MADKYHETVKASGVISDDAAVQAAVEKIIAEHLEENMNADVYKFLFNCLDLTTLSPMDSPQSVARFV
ncbi:MAG: deoxyribose-phosphate aldolase, partial [Muribaculaceae bacterium]|nr:deoxyribose-phosphate aldolase [Muribaculaceae bacterium]